MNKCVGLIHNFKLKTAHAAFIQFLHLTPFIRSDSRTCRETGYWWNKRDRKVYFLSFIRDPGTCKLLTTHFPPDLHAPWSVDILRRETCLLYTWVLHDFNVLVVVWRAIFIKSCPRHSFHINHFKGIRILCTNWLDFLTHAG